MITFDKPVVAFYLSEWERQKSEIAETVREQAESRGFISAVEMLHGVLLEGRGTRWVFDSNMTQAQRDKCLELMDALEQAPKPVQAPQQPLDGI